MAKQVVTTLVDDIDGSEAVETIAFAYRGVNYSIDLNEKNAAAFDKAVAKYLDNATRESGRRPAGRAAGSGSSTAKRTDLADVRAWASDNGYEVSARGRIAGQVLEAYDAAH